MVLGPDEKHLTYIYKDRLGHISNKDALVYRGMNATNACTRKQLQKSFTSIKESTEAHFKKVHMFMHEDMVYHVRAALVSIQLFSFTVFLVSIK